MRLFVSLFFLLLLSPPCFAAIFYVRPDGGDLGSTSTTCNGRYDVAYVAGQGPNCAVSHPNWIFNGTVPYSGGDTIVIDGEYKMGYYSGVNVSGCSEFSPYGCSISILGGAVGNRTKIVGKNYNTGCSSKAILYGSGRMDTLINISNQSHIEFQCIEITDHSECVYAVSGPHPKNCSSSSPYSDDNWVLRGILNNGATYSQDLYFKNMHIHGIGLYGLQLNITTDIVIEDSTIEGISSSSPMQFTIGTLDTVTDNTITIRRSNIQFNGCVEEYPITHTGSDKFDLCCAQSICGYTTDGIEISGIDNSLGTIVIEDSNISHNTHDGVDLLYGSGDGSVSIKRSTIMGNQGNQIKLATSAIIEDSFIDGRCSYFSSLYSGKRCQPAEGCTNGEGNYCRAFGSTIAFDIKVAGQTLEVYNSTILSEGDTNIQTQGADGVCTGTENTTSRNNVWVGGAQYDLNSPTGGYKTSDDVTLFYNNGAGNGAGSCGSGVNAPVFDSDYDIFHGYAEHPTTSATLLNTDPMLTDLTVRSGAYDTNTTWSCADYNDCMSNGGMIPSVGSPAISFASEAVSGLDAYDVNSFNRGADWDVGALDYGSSISCGEEGATCAISSDCCMNSCLNFTCKMPGSYLYNITPTGSIKFQ